MSNPTTPFSWQMPTATDLVTDLPADFEVFGQAVATSMADLLGGTTGQILSKTSNTDMDFTWINNDQGDITGVTAGTGISGGGTSGTVTVTNSMATAIDAKGDLIGGTGADTFARLAVGANGTVLTADSAEATGLKWAAGGVTFAGASVYASAAVSIPNGTLTVVTWNSEDFDTNSFHSTSVNTGRFTIPTAGKYLINAMIGWDTTANTTTKTLVLRKNGTDVLKSNGLGTGSDYQSQSLQYIASAAVNDYFEILAYQVTGGAINILQNANSTYQISFLGA
jgi:hypothetical protein